MSLVPAADEAYNGLSFPLRFVPVVAHLLHRQALSCNAASFIHGARNQTWNLNLDQWVPRSQAADSLFLITSWFQKFWMRHVSSLGKCSPVVKEDIFKCSPLLLLNPTVVWFHECRTWEILGASEILTEINPMLETQRFNSNVQDGAVREVTEFKGFFNGPSQMAKTKTPGYTLYKTCQ